MNMGTPHPCRNQGKILKSHGIERVKLPGVAIFLFQKQSLWQYVNLGTAPK